MSIRKAQVDFFSPMTGNFFRRGTRRDDLFVSPPTLQDPSSIADDFDKKYGVISDEEATKIIEDQKPEVVEDEVTLPVIKPDPEPEEPEEPKKKKKKAKKKAKGFATNRMRKSRSGYKSKARVANRKKAQAMAKKRLAKKKAQAKKKAATSKPSGFGGLSNKNRGRRGRRGGAKGGSGGSGSSSKGGTGAGKTRTSRKASSASRGRTGRGRSQCDIRTKIDITPLTNQNLMRDDLADVAYFVRTLQKN